MAFSKYHRNPSDQTLRDVQEELADVGIMLRQMAMMFSEEEINRIASEKIERLRERLEDEHKEPEIDWENVPIDTPILVKDGEEDEWLKRYFAGANEDGAAIAWADGRTSFTATDIYDWEQAKLWEGSEEQAEEERQKREAANE